VISSAVRKPLSISLREDSPAAEDEKEKLIKGLVKMSVHKDERKTTHRGE
jgi:hypothetical protein